jgi:glycosyltransferase involved in cell wall biosynthesis
LVRFDGVAVARLERRPLGTALSVPADVAGLALAAGRLRAAGFSAELVHAHVFAAAFVALPLAVRRPLVISEHFSGLTGRLSRRELAAARVAYARARLVCPVSESLRRTIEGRGLRARFRVVPNPVDPKFFHPPPETRPAAGPARVLAVGSLLPIKGMRYLVEAAGLIARRRQDVEFEVIGDGPERAALAALAAPLGARFRFAGQRDRVEVAEAMRAADVLAIPSEGETFSVTAAEGLCSGLPVVASAVGALPEVVGPAGGVLVRPRDPPALTAGIEQALARPPGDRRALAEAALRRFGTDVVAATWADLYGRVVTREAA